MRDQRSLGLMWQVCGIGVFNSDPAVFNPAETSGENW